MINPTLEFLYGLHHRGIKLGLKNISDFLSLCKILTKKLKPFTLLGLMVKVNRLYSSKNFTRKWPKSWTLTSPHLIRFNERIRINGCPIPDQEIIDFIQQHQKTIMDSSFTFFEETHCPCFYLF
ncbi:MAG: hypothetical protein CM1200mP31_3200 [Candidatus Neomarinimicrobiota bacterium]|nr:MAG: hypothetical protein CM1200mP31_3200 [Candidatus Neomarinimicrobiota bacterium]